MGGNADGRNKPELQAYAPRALLPAMRSEHVLTAGRREQAEVLSMQPCCIAGHRYRPVRDLDTSHLLLVCTRCTDAPDWTEARAGWDGV